MRRGRGGRGWCGPCWHRWCWLFAAAVLCGAVAAATALAPLRCPPALSDPSRCHCEQLALKTFNCSVDGAELELSESDCFKLKSPGGVFNVTALPSFETLRYKACAKFSPASGTHRALLATAPDEPSYAAILRAVNVSSPHLHLINGMLRSERLADLTALRRLELWNIEFEPNARNLTHLKGLKILSLDGTAFSTADLAYLPTGLQTLHLVNTNIGFVPADALARLRNLTKLHVIDKISVRIELTDGLKELNLNSESDCNLTSFKLPRTLEVLSLKAWAPREPRPWEACAILKTLMIVKPAVEVLPTDWVRNCRELKKLSVTSARNLTLQKDVLRGAENLQRIEFTDCSLNSLPDHLLRDTEKLQILDLSRNNLLWLPGDLLECTPLLQQLILSYNRLTNSALSVVEDCKSLRVLNLVNNTALDACPNTASSETQQESMFHNLKKLSTLSLSSTSTSQVCPDWRQLPRLEHLNLFNTAVVHLKRAHLRFNSSKGKVEVSLENTNVRTLKFERRDLEAWEAGYASGAPVVVKLDLPLQCDCGMYWTAAALCNRSSKAVVDQLQVKYARCMGKGNLCDVSLDEMVCTATNVSCPKGCHCGVREDRAPPGRVLRLFCEGAGLDAVPSAVKTLADLAAQAEPATPAALGYALHLHLANNSIRALSPEDLPPELAALDLRNNSLKLIDATTAKKMVSRENLRVFLAGNPLQCNCNFTGVLNVVSLNSKVIADSNVIRCANGTKLKEAAINVLQSCKYGGYGTADPGAGETNLTAIVVASLSVIVVVAAALVLALLRPELRLRAKRVLRAWGLLPRAREADDGRVYDAFVSFAHADEAVVHELVERLESGATPLRLCVHYRDWVPGGWIPTQIAASVRVSRRTVAVVSAAFLRSAWARAEFREAYAAALRDAEPRLVVVLLEDPARLPLDAELRAYLSANTYVRWGDPWFWMKLRRALPAPRIQIERPAENDLPSTDVSVSWRSATTLSTGASELFGVTLSTDASQRSATTLSTDASQRSAMSLSTDASQRSATTFSTDASQRSATALSTDASQRSATALTTDASQRSATTLSTDASQRSATALSTDASQRSATALSTDASQRSATALSTDASQGSATALSTDASQRPATTLSTDASQRSATTISTDASQRSAKTSSTDASEIH